MIKDFVCPDCASKEIKIVEDSLCKCVVCGAFFDLEDTPLTEKIVRTKPRRKYNEDDDGE